MQEPTRWIPFANLLPLLCFGQSRVSPDCLHRLKVGAVTGKVLERASGSEEAVVGLQGLQRVNRLC
ncbi:putative atp-dependent RNA helicase k03h1.2 in chromosome iii [Giardia duodenalis assemblage B]|uniref:Putative atp-dependent RNA helicase k03h1.2 in chromosome iii n=1 Tax=Giardia duodenalis assemblage B TaxID=1394984 RepID=A0A132NM28_GIAIN|nr:putative atp-dependent RNA helicase k03h1.2 in chromosome iii [Giardia intestinalis assemblage B]